MYRAATSRFRALKGHVGNGAVAARFATSSVTAKSSGGLFSWLTGERSSQLPPLDFPLPDVTLPPSLPDYVEPGKTKITTLPNGVKIASETSTENYTAPRMVLGASGVEHEELLSYAVPLLSDLPMVPAPVVPKSAYVGGDYRCQADSPSTHVALAFEVSGGWLKEREAMALTVLQMLMGGGGSFSAGVPGKGMYSQLYLRTLNEFRQIESFSAFNSICNNTGIFGIHATTVLKAAAFSMKLLPCSSTVVAAPTHQNWLLLRSF